MVELLEVRTYAPNLRHLRVNYTPTMGPLDPLDDGPWAFAIRQLLKVLRIQLEDVEDKCIWLRCFGHNYFLDDVFERSIGHLEDLKNQEFADDEDVQVDYSRPITTSRFTQRFFGAMELTWLNQYEALWDPGRQKKAKA